MRLQYGVYMEKTKLISYNQIEKIHGDYLVEAGGYIWTTEQNMQTFPSMVYLHSPLPVKEYHALMEKLKHVFGGGQ